MCTSRVHLPVPEADIVQGPVSGTKCSDLKPPEEPQRTVPKAKERESTYDLITEGLCTSPILIT
jgi:hypothetical protein